MLERDTYINENGCSESVGSSRPFKEFLSEAFFAFQSSTGKRMTYPCLLPW
jgi:hypothetical protein